MDWLLDAQSWLAFGILASLEVILGFDNVIVLSLLVGQLPAAQRRGARLFGLSFALLTRLALLFSITWLTTLATWRTAVLLGGGLLLVGGSVRELARSGTAKPPVRAVRSARSYWLVVLQVGLLDLVFSLDTVFTAVGLANRIEIMVAAIVFAIVVMLVLSAAAAALLERHPGVKSVGLALLVPVGASLCADGLGWHVSKGWLYGVLALVAVVGAALVRARERRAGQR